MTDTASGSEIKVCPRCAETIQAAAHVCHYCGQEFEFHRSGYCPTCHRRQVIGERDTCPGCGTEVTDILIESQPVAGHIDAPLPNVVPTPPPPPVEVPTPGSASQPKPKRGGTIVLKVLAAIGLLALVFVGIAIYFGTRPVAPSPSDLADRFDDAGVVCREFDKIYDDRDQKALGCVTQDSQVLTITTYGDRPDPKTWLADSCATRSAQQNQAGYYVVGDDFIIDMTQGAFPEALGAPTPIAQTSAALADELDGTATAYDCAQVDAGG